MIYRANIGSGISGAMRYVRGPGRDETGQLKTTGKRDITLGGQGFGFDVTDANLDLARKMMEHNNSREMQGTKARYCDKGALHMSLSWARGQNPSREEQIEAAREFMKAIGMKDAMATYHAHTDKSFAHVHVIGSRVNPLDKHGRTFDDYQQRYKGIRRAIEWEREKNQITKQTQHAHDWAQAVEDRDYDRLRELLMKNEATLRKTKLDLSMAMGGKLGEQLEAEREAFVREQNMIRLTQYRGGKVQAYTTPEIWREETQTLGSAHRVHGQEHQAVSDEILERIADEMTLDEEQREALRHVTRGKGLSMISGEAGTGKSHVQMATRKALEQSNKKVIGQAFTNKVTQNMARDGFDARTIDSELSRLRGGQYRWDRDTVIMPDEAAQISTEHLKEMFRYAERDGARLIMSGDGKQLGSIKMGGLWNQLEKRFGTARLTDVKRNRDPDQKRAFNKMHERKFKEAVDIFKEKGSIRWNGTKEQSGKALTEDYMRDFLEDPDARRLIMAGTNDDVDQLNQFARDLRRQHGKLGPDVQLDTDKGPKPFAVGDRLSMNESSPNPKDKKKGLVNGAFGEVEAIHNLDNGQKEITLKLDRKRGEQERKFRFTVGMNKDAKEISGINHGYASTVYKSQGDTLDKTYVQHNPQSEAPTNYVELSRHADKVKLYVSREETNGYADLTEQLKHGRDKTAAHDYQVHEGDREKLNQPIQRTQERGRYQAPERASEPEPNTGEWLQDTFGRIQDMASKAKRVIEQAMEIGR